ncbi:MAG: PEP-CTERM sorting domain-containing protein [Phycisphaerae bacterium]
MANWTGTAAGASVPEPATFVTLAAGTLAMFRRRRRHLPS